MCAFYDWWICQNIQNHKALYKRVWKYFTNNHHYIFAKKMPLVTTVVSKLVVCICILKYLCPLFLFNHCYQWWNSWNVITTPNRAIASKIFRLHTSWKIHCPFPLKPRFEELDTKTRKILTLINTGINYWNFPFIWRISLIFLQLQMYIVIENNLSDSLAEYLIQTFINCLLQQISVETKF